MTNKTVMVPVELLEAAIEYMEYTHNGDPYEEDARAMGEMGLDDIKHKYGVGHFKAMLYAAPQQAKAEWLPYPKYKPEDASVNPFCLCLIEGKHPVVGSYADNYDHFVYMGGSVSGNVTHFIQIPQPTEQTE